MKRTKCVLLSMVLILFVVFTTTVLSKNGNVKAYTLDENGEIEYSIAGDKYVYQAEEVYTKTINTFEAWICLPSTLADNVIGGIIFGNQFNSNFGYPGCVNYGVAKNGNFYLYWNNGQYKHTFTGFDLRTGEWTHVAIVRDTALGKLLYYVNGEVIEEIDVTLSESVCKIKYSVGCDYNNWFVNEWGTNKTPFMGKIKQVTVYSESISKEGILQDISDSEITTAERGEGLMANYYFGENWAKDEIIYDTSDNGINCKKATYDCYVPVKEYEDYDYSFIVVPDMQAMTYWNANNFYAQSQWIVDSAEKLNTKFVMYLGDMTESKYSKEPEKSESEWIIARNAMSILDGKVPYTFVLGNHDYDNWANLSRDTVMFDKYFPYEKYSKTQYFGGALKEGDMANTYHFIKVGDIEYLIFCLEFGPGYNVLNWADRIISEHPHSRVIITSHSLLQPTGEFTHKNMTGAPSKYISYAPVSEGEDVWNNLLRKHPNIMMSFSGHLSTDEVVINESIGDNGNLVRSVLVDAQGAILTSAMNTLLVVKVNEREKLMNFCYYSPEYDACYNYQSQFTLSFADANNPTVGIPEEEPATTGVDGKGILFGTALQAVLVAMAYIKRKGGLL